MTSALFCLLPLLLPCQEPVQKPAVEAAPAEAVQLAAACKALGAAKNYTWESTTESSGGFGGRGDSAPPVITGRFQNGKPVHFKSEGWEAWRSEEHLCWRSGEEAWQTLDPESMRGGRGGGGGGDRRTMFAMLRLQGAPLPHELLRDPGAHFTKVERSETEGGVRYKAELTEAGFEKAGGSMGGRFGGSAEMERTGTVQLAFGAKGQLESMVLDTRVAGSFRDRDFVRTSTTSMKLSDLGKTEVVVPEAAAKALVAAASYREEF